MAVEWSKDLLDVYYKYRDKMDNGDILEFSTSSMIGSMIRFFTKKDVNHTAILWHVDQFKSIKDRRFIMEALNNGIELNLLSARLKNYKGNVYWYSLRKEHEDKRDRAASICLLTEGRTDELKYDYLSLVKQMYTKVSVDVEKHSFCSEFAQWVLQEAKILGKQGKALRPGEFGKLGIFKPRVQIYSWGMK